MLLAAMVGRIDGPTQLGAWIAASVLLGGCASTTVEVEGKFPDPLVEPLPVAIGLHMPESFRTYTVEQDIPKRGRYSVEIGDAQSAMMQRVLTPMFQRVVNVAHVDAARGRDDLDAVLIAQVHDIQFAIPFQTKSKFYEVWVKYRFQLVEPNGSSISDWKQIGYGKARSGMLSGDAAALQKAAMEALRDAGAFFAIGFSQRPEVRQWLDDQPRAGKQQPPATRTSKDETNGSTGTDDDQPT